MSFVVVVVVVPQVPAVWPAGTMQDRPVQQSDVEVQTPPDIEQLVPQRSVPLESGRHGAPLQHSPEKVQVLPALMQHGATPV